MGAKDIFDKAILLKPGQSLLVPCHDLRQQESLRVGLAIQRRHFLASTDTDFDIISSKVTKAGKPFISLSRLPRITTGFIVSENGEVETTSLIPDPVSNIGRDALDLNRIRKAMKDDGYSDEQIEAYLNSEKVSKIDASDETVCLDPDKEGV